MGRLPLLICMRCKWRIWRKGKLDDENRRNNILPLPKDAEEDYEEKDIVIDETYADISNRKIWSYPFLINDIDDFQLTLKNPNGLFYEHATAWSENKDVLYVRVTVGPSPDNEGILFITFSKPCNTPYFIINYMML